MLVKNKLLMIYAIIRLVLFNNALDKFFIIRMTVYQTSKIYTICYSVSGIFIPQIYDRNDFCDFMNENLNL